MPFGMSSVSKVKQEENKQKFSDILGVHVIAVGITTAASYQQENDAVFRQMMGRARKNLDKMQFKVNAVAYMSSLNAVQF